MRFMIEDLEVLWPYDYIYPEQHAYMHKLYATLRQTRGHCLLEMPTGTGKTISLLALILAFQYHKQKNEGKLIYCTRTVQEMDKVVEELRRVTAYREAEMIKTIAAAAAAPTVDASSSSSTPPPSSSSSSSSVSSSSSHEQQLAAEVQKRIDPRIFGVCLSSRRNMCIHEDVSSFDNRGKVDALCRNLTASFVREERQAAAESEPSSSSKVSGGLPCCSYYEGFEQNARCVEIKGIYSLADLKVLGRERGWCPYFYARYALNNANVVVFNYQYMLDPKISGLVSSGLDAASIVVFDEAHNIDNICIEALSVQIDARTVNAASQNLSSLQRKVNEVERTDSARLQREYTHLLRGLHQARDDGQQQQHDEEDEDEDGDDEVREERRPAAPAVSVSNEEATDVLRASPVLPADVLREAVPGSIRRAKHFLLLLRSWVEYLKHRLQQQAVTQETPVAFLLDLQQRTEMGETRALRFCYDRLQTLFRTLRLSDIDQFTPISVVATFATVVATYSQGFALIYEPFDERTPSIPDPRLQLCCLDASIAIKPVFERFHTVIITSGTLSPLDVYPRVLNFTPCISESLTMSLARNVIAPMVVSKGADQVPISSKFELRQDVGVIQNYGRLLIELASVVPDGIVGFFTSYRYMEDVIAAWKQLGVIDELLRLKLIFIETKDVVETTLALDAYKRACSSGRGALFLSVARGKVAEGIDFDRHYGRAVVIFGIPFQYTLSRVLRARLQYLQDEFQLSEADFLVFDAMRQTAQCVGRVIRSKNDYGLMIFADARFARADRRNKLPKWITQFMDNQSLNLSTDRAITLSREFLRNMAQPRDRLAEIGVTLLNEAHLERRNQQAEQQRRVTEGV